MVKNKKRKPCILWIGDAIAPTGFARVNHSIIKYLTKTYDIHQLGVNYMGDPHDYKYKIYPAMIGGDVWGFGRFINLIQNIKPDLIFMLNDPWAIKRYIDLLLQNDINIPVVLYFPVDATNHQKEWYKDFYKVAKAICVYTKFAKDVVTKTGVIMPEDINIIPHGIDKSIFYPLKPLTNKEGNVIKTGEQLAREAVFPTKKKPELLDAFVILNANRNTQRKRVDLTMQAFAEFVKDKEDAYLYLHMGIKDMGWDIIKLAQRYGFENRLIITSKENRLPDVPDARLNLIYNAANVGINNGLGEGWGLTSWEQGACKKPQIVPDNSVFREIWKDNCMIVPAPILSTYEETLTVGHMSKVEDVTKAMQWAYDDWQNNDSKELNEIAENAYTMIMQPEYIWKNISKRFDNIFRKVLTK